RRYPRLRHHLQGLSPRNPRTGAPLRGAAPLYSCASLLARSFDLRGIDSQQPTRTWQLSLRHIPDFPRLLRPDHDSLPAEVFVPPAALLRHSGYGQHPGGLWGGRLAASREAIASCGRDEQARPLDDLHCRAPAGWLEHAGRRIARRNAGTPLPRAPTSRPYSVERVLRAQSEESTISE